MAVAELVFVNRHGSDKIKYRTSNAEPQNIQI